MCIYQVHLMGELTRLAGPGDEVELSGIFLPTPYTGYRAMKAGLTADTYLEATCVHRIKERYQDYTFSSDLEQQILEQSQEPGTYAKLARSIAPEIWGHEGVMPCVEFSVTSWFCVGFSLQAQNVAAFSGVHVRVHVWEAACANGWLWCLRSEHT